MLLSCVAMIFLLVQFSPQAESSSTVSIANNEIWLQSPAGDRQLTHDGVPKRLPTLAPSGNELAYVVDKDVPDNAPEEEIVILNLKGETLQRIVPTGYVPREFGRLEWLDAERIGAMACGHANCEYWVLNPVSGKTIQVMSGGFDFIWSHNRQFVARHFVALYGDGPEGELLPEHDAVLLNRDNEFLYPPNSERSDDTHSHDIGRGNWPPFVWSPNDDWVAFTDLIGPEGDSYVVLLSPKGEILRETLPVDVGFDATLEWQDDSHLQVQTGGKTYFFALNGKQLTEVRAIH